MDPRKKVKIEEPEEKRVPRRKIDIFSTFFFKTFSDCRSRRASNNTGREPIIQIGDQIRPQ
jgi:hypothetical protein